MKYFKYLLFVNLCWNNVSTGQVNLIPNPGFEIVDTCYLHSGGISLGYIPPWDSPTAWASPDAFNICSPLVSLFWVPNNNFGFQNPHTGNGYAGAQFLWYSTTDYKEYIQIELDSQLVAQREYCTSFYVCLANSSQLACNNIGMYFSNTHTFVSSFQGTLNLVPQINATNIINDTLNWTLISGSYIANGGERYIIIGNFYSNSLTDTTQIQPSGNNSYYYIDDVDVHCCSCSEQGVKEEGNKEGVNVYPNPATNELTIELKNIKAKSIKVINVLGEVVTNKEKVGVGKMEVDVGNLAKGIYFVEVESDVGIMRRKFVKE